MSLIYCLKACQREREAEGGDGGRRRGGRPDREKLELKGRRVLLMEGERGETGRGKDGEGNCPSE